MAAPELSDFFAKKSKKKIKATNLNTATNTAKPEETQKKKTTEEEDEWKEEEVSLPTMQVAAAGKLMREEEKKEEEEAAACRWKPQPNKEVSAIKDARDEKRFPTLSRATKSSNITIGDEEAKVNIKTSVNVFAALDGEHSSEDDAPKKPSSIVPARVQKKKGERETAAIEREKEKYGVADKPTKKKTKAAAKDADDEDDEDDEDAEEEAEEAEAEAPKKKKASKKAKEEVDEEKPEPKKDEAEDLKIVPDMEACKAKYESRKKPFPPKPLPRSEMQEEKENRPKQQVGGGKKKKKGGMAGWDDEEDNGKKKLLEVYAWRPEDEED